MYCPVCKTHSLAPTTLVNELPAYRCSTCKGVWIDSNAFLDWRRTKGDTLPERPGTSQIDPAWDLKELKLCPNCGRILRRFKVIPGEPLYIERCHTCNGMWLDHHEWSALVERNLHDNLNEFFTRAWQDRIRTEETRAHLDQLYLEKFGGQDYERIKEARLWLQEHQQRGMLLAFLQSDDPYQL
jgi:Zn-finger nucleic acid-binding protein